MGDSLPVYADPLAFLPPLCYTIKVEVVSVNMQESYRLIEALESAGWQAREIVDLIKYVESGNEKYKPIVKAQPMEQAGE